jgi:hypothetical protein
MIWIAVSAGIAASMIRTFSFDSSIFSGREWEDRNDYLVFAHALFLLCVLPSLPVFACDLCSWIEATLSAAARDQPSAQGRPEDSR